MSPIEVLVYPTREGHFQARIKCSVAGVERCLWGVPQTSEERAAEDAFRTLRWVRANPDHGRFWERPRG